MFKWPFINKRKWDILLKNTDSSNNYLIYRKLLKSSKINNQHKKDHPLIVICFKLYVKVL